MALLDDPDRLTRLLQDHAPRLWSSADVAALQDLASLVARDVERRMTVAAACAGGEVGG